ncbi:MULTISPECIES: hypothetical protein [unclassified Capnocytophaga]|nr:MULTISPECIES: hypothetical protein [unclassified Capnocytophaga]MEB3004940.1 hypothetical protein [Capnocytophaga sp. G2]
MFLYDFCHKYNHLFFHKKVRREFCMEHTTESPEEDKDESLHLKDL